MQERVEIAPHLRFAWDAFHALEGDRIGYGASPTPFVSLNAFARRYGITDIDEFDSLRALISALDRVYCEHHNKPSK